MEGNSCCPPNPKQVTYPKAIKSSFELAGISFVFLLSDSDEAKGFFNRSILTLRELFLKHKIFYTLNIQANWNESFIC